MRTRGAATGLGDIAEVGSLFGASNPRTDVLKMLRLYQDDVLELDELVTRTYQLDEIAQGYEDMHAGTNLRGVVLY